MKIIVSLTVKNQLFTLEIFTWKFPSFSSRRPEFQKEWKENYDFFHKLILTCVESQVTTVSKRKTPSPEFSEKHRNSLHRRLKWQAVAKGRWIQCILSSGLEILRVPVKKQRTKHNRIFHHWCKQVKGEFLIIFGFCRVELKRIWHCQILCCWFVLAYVKKYFQRWAGAEQLAQTQ